MKSKFLTIFSCILLAVTVSGQEKNAGNSLKVLTIGNSFSRSLATYLPAAVRSAGYTIELENVYIGAATLKTHWDNIEKEGLNPDFKYFRKYTYKDLLQKKKWDVVTIQQGSHDSWQYQTYMPYAGNMIDFIKEFAPQAKIMIQQTWAYRPDDRRLGKWKIDQKQMYDALVDAYGKAAAELNIKVIPVGTAVQLARETASVKYVPYNRADFKYPDLPDMTGSYVGSIKWSKDKKRLEGDTFHLNRKGEFLQACVWFAVLFDRPVSDIKLEPRGIDKAEVEFLKNIAQKAVDEYKRKDSNPAAGPTQ